tara:strand:+ start:13 stop:1206 length:1194 start_codon:yes stop_codon:yes gene_type:complete
MLFSNRAIFNRNAIARTWVKTMTGIGVMLANITWPWLSFNINRRTLPDGTTHHAWKMGPAAPDAATAPYTPRVSNLPKTTISFSIYLSTAWLDNWASHTAGRVALNDDEGVKYNIFWRGLENQGLSQVVINTAADVVGASPAINGQLGFGRYANDPLAGTYDGWIGLYYTSGSTPVTGDGVLKFPFMRSEVENQWVTFTMSVSQVQADFLDHTPMLSAGGDWFWGRVTMVNSTDAITMDAASSAFYNYGYITEWPLAQQYDGNGNSLHKFEIGSGNFNSTMATDPDLPMSNFWLLEGDVIDPTAATSLSNPKPLHTEFSWHGIPSLALSVKQKTPNLYLASRTSAEMTITGNLISLGHYYNPAYKLHSVDFNNVYQVAGKGDETNRQDLLGPDVFSL